MYDSKAVSKKYPMTSLDVVKKLSIYLTHYFSRYRKEICYDLSGPLLPLKHYPSRYQRTLIDYQQDVSKHVKHYFSPLDLRKRLTTFHQDVVDEGRHKAILQKIEEYIQCITTNKDLYRTTNEKRRAPWDSFWWKTHDLSFQSKMFSVRYECSRNKSNFYNRYNSDFFYGDIRNRLRNKKVKMYRNYGAQPVLKMCPNPYASRGEAERIINHAARLLLVTENYDVKGYEYTAPGMKIKQVNKKKTAKLSGKLKSYASSKKCSDTDINKINSADSTTTSGNRLNTFKIKKNMKSFDSNLEIEPKVFPAEASSSGKMLEYYDDKDSNDSLDENVDIFDFDYDSNVKINAEKNEKNKIKEKCEKLVCCKKAVSVKSSINNEKLKKKEVQIYPEEKNSSLKKENGSLTFTTFKSVENQNISKGIINPIKEKKRDFHIIKTEKSDFNITKTEKIVPIIKMNSDSFEESVDITVDSQDTDVSGWLFNGSGLKNNNDNCYIKSSSKENLVRQVFEVKVSTGDRIGASTNATVWLYIVGNKASLKHSAELKKSPGHRKLFCRGKTDMFKIKSSKYLGSIISIQIGHDSDQPGSDWFLDSVSIRDCTHQLSYFFPCFKWLSIRSEDKQTRVNIPSKPYLHEAKMVNPDIKKSDAATQYSDICEENENKDFVFNFQTKENSNLKNIDSLSDLAVEFSELSFSASFASSLMSVRRNNRYMESELFNMPDPFNDNVEEASVSVKENMSDLPIDYIFKNEHDYHSENSVNENAEASYSSNPISFCDEASL